MTPSSSTPVLKPATDSRTRKCETRDTYQDQIRKQLAMAPGKTASAPYGKPAAEAALKEANRLDDVLMDTIRQELHTAATAVRAKPIPLSPPA
jgi:hypothetical protein